MTALRAGLFVLWFYGSMTVIGLLGMPLMLLSPRYGIDVARTWSAVSMWGLRWICGVKIRVDGKAHIPQGAAIVAGKHQAQLDTVAPFVLLPRPAFVLKKELLAMPVFGYFAGRSGHIPVDREAQASALKTMLRAARKARDEGRQIVIFPEGTRHAPGEPSEYKIGVFALYRDLGVPCVPLALDTGRVWSKSGYKIKPGVTTFRFLEPIPPGLSRDAFMQTLQTRLDAESAALLAADPA
ncbi:MAG: 1-acyl-sn-glycerol-3-phosphate acyltransferase [Alphaproteobacteria bacterium]|nr:1-acyl-sn-glycerol-3-phosphate acyltransferase [Alphaproteobacteria bacterium]